MSKLQQKSYAKRFGKHRAHYIVTSVGAESCSDLCVDDGILSINGSEVSESSTMDDVVEMMLARKEQASLRIVRAAEGAPRKNKKKTGGTSSSTALVQKSEKSFEGKRKASSALSESKLPASSTSTKLVRKKARFVMPVAGRDGASANSLSGMTFVLTGIFPSVGGGTGLKLGKDRLKRMIQTFGGRVTSAISGKTNVLVVGKAPGFSKVSKARARSGQVQLMGVQGLVDAIKDNLITDGEPFVIQGGFSAGYGGNSRALTASARELEKVRGTTDAPMAIKSGKKSKKKKK